eukprot:512798-Rhodomonas_salina.1
MLCASLASLAVSLALCPARCKAKRAEAYNMLFHLIVLHCTQQVAIHLLRPVSACQRVREEHAWRARRRRLMLLPHVVEHFLLLGHALPARVGNWEER